MESQTDLLQQWIGACHHLDQAIDHFLESTNALYANRASYSNASDLDLREKATSEAHQFLHSMDARIDKLQNTQPTLRKIRNESASLVPINKLPLEILIQIFQICTRFINPFEAFFEGPLQHPKELISITHVCAHWRETAISAPALWSHLYFDIDVFVKTNSSKCYNPFPLHVERARDQLSCITFRSGTTVRVCKKFRKAIGNLLGHHMKNVTTLRFIDIPHIDVLAFLLKLWRTEGRPGSVRSLIMGPENQNVSEGKTWRTNMAFWPRGAKELWSSLLLPIRELRMVGSHFRWDGPLFHNLVVLQVGHVSRAANLKLQDILAALSASPHLETLQLFYIFIPYDDPTGLQPVVFDSLKVLDVRHLEFPSLQLLLPMIIAHSQELSVGMPMYLNLAEIGPLVQSFLARSNVTRLFLNPEPFSIADVPLIEYLSAAPNLHTLILELGSGTGDTLLHALVQSNPPTTPTSRCPQLHTLYLMNGSLHTETVQKIVEVHPHLRKLEFLPCFLEPSDEEVLYGLRPLVQSATCSNRKLSPEVMRNWFTVLI